jgi:hypothetical protein
MSSLSTDEEDVSPPTYVLSGPTAGLTSRIPSLKNFHFLFLRTYQRHKASNRCPLQCAHTWCYNSHTVSKSIACLSLFVLLHFGRCSGSSDNGNRITVMSLERGIGQQWNITDFSRGWILSTTT